MTQPHEATEIDQLKVILEAPESLDLIDPFNHLSPPSREWLDEKLKRMRTYFKEALDQKDLSLESKAEGEVLRLRSQVQEYEKRIRDLQSRLQAGRVPPYIVLAMEAALKAFIDEWGRKLISFEVLAQAEKAYNEYQLYKEQEALKSSEEKGLV